MSESGHPFLLLAFLLGLALALPACGGGGSGAADTLGYGSHPVPSDSGDLPPGPPPDDGSGGPPLFPELTGGVLVTLDSQGEIWRWWITNPVTASYMEQKWRGTYVGRFGGRLRAGPGEAGHNAPWSWHVDPEENFHDIVFFAPPSGGPTTPSECENELDRWLSQHTLFGGYPYTIVSFDDRRP